MPRQLLYYTHERRYRKGSEVKRIVHSAVSDEIRLSSHDHDRRLRNTELTTNHLEKKREICRYTIFFFFNDTTTTEIYTLSLHDALLFFFKEHASHLHSHFFPTCRLPL